MKDYDCIDLHRFEMYLKNIFMDLATPSHAPFSTQIMPLIYSCAPVRICAMPLTHPHAPAQICNTHTPHTLVHPPWPVPCLLCTLQEPCCAPCAFDPRCAFCTPLLHLLYTPLHPMLNPFVHLPQPSSALPHTRLFPPPPGRRDLPACHPGLKTSY